MSRARVAVLKVISTELSVTAAAAEYGYSRQHLHRLLATLDHTTATVIELRTGEILSTHTIDPTRSYWRNTKQARADGPSLTETVTHVATHLSPMSRLNTERRAWDSNP